LKEKLSDLCREQKQTISPRKTNQDVAENTDLSVGTVSQFLRGDIKNPSVYTVGPICREMGVSIDDYFGIPHDEPAEPSDAEMLRAENASLRAQLAQHQKSLRMHRLVTLILLGILSLCALALLVDVLSPSIGWIRT
jgi:transcriptional regulator with XRE-family HTH domain